MFAASIWCLLTALTLGLSDGAYGAPITTANHAIAIGTKACEAFEKRMGAPDRADRTSSSPFQGSDIVPGVISGGGSMLDLISTLAVMAMMGGYFWLIALGIIDIVRGLRRMG